MDKSFVRMTNWSAAGARGQSKSERGRGLTSVFTAINQVAGHTEVVEILENMFHSRRHWEFDVASDNQLLMNHTRTPNSKQRQVRSYDSLTMSTFIKLFPKSIGFFLRHTAYIRNLLDLFCLSYLGPPKEEEEGPRDCIKPVDFIDLSYAKEYPVEDQGQDFTL